MPEPNVAQAALVEEVFVRVIRGDALTRIAADFNERGLLPRRGQRWTHTGIARLIASPALAGMVDQGGEYVRGAFEGVVSEERWRAAQAALRRRPRGELRRPREKLTLLGGTLTCAEHGDVLWGGGKAHAAIYVLRAPGLSCHVSITRVAADDLVERLILSRLKQPDAAELLTMKTSHRSTVEAELTSLRGRREDLIGLIADGLLTAAAARDSFGTLAVRLQELEAIAHDQPFSDAELLDLEQAWQGWTMPQRRSVVQMLFSAITLEHTDGRNGPRADPTRIHCTWRSPNEHDPL